LFSFNDDAHYFSLYYQLKNKYDVYNRAMNSVNRYSKSNEILGDALPEIIVNISDGELINSQLFFQIKLKLNENFSTFK
jgi:hypothetical protein